MGRHRGPRHGAKRVERPGGPGGGRAGTGPAQGLVDRADDERPHQRRLAEAHLGLGRMHVDVDVAGIAGDREGEDRVTVGAHGVGISPAHRAEQQPVPHRAAVDGEVNVARRSAMEGRQPDMAGEREAFAGHVERHGIGAEIGTQHRRQPAQGRCRPGLGLGGEDQRAAALGAQGEADARLRHREAAQDVGDGRTFRPIRLEELEPSRCRREQVGDFDACAGRGGGRPHLSLHAGLDQEAHSGLGRGSSAGDGESRHGADRRKGLAAKAQRRDPAEVAVGEL